jgi:hypothetical protein
MTDFSTLSLAEAVDALLAVSAAHFGLTRPVDGFVLTIGSLLSMPTD